MFFSNNCKLQGSSRRSTSSSPCVFSAILIVIVAICAAVAPRSAYAQEADDTESEEQSTNGIRSFESVRVQRIKPHDLPTQSKPGAPTGIRTQPEDLPQAPTEDQLKVTRARVRAATIRVAKLQTPARPYRQEPRVSFGHAVRVEVPGTDGDEAAVIASLAWLADADAVYVVPDELATKHAEDKDWMKVRRRTLRSVTAGAEGREWYEENREKLIEVELEHRDKHRNLVTLAADDLAELLGEPLELFPYDKKGLFYAYGYSPYFGDAIAQTTIAPSHPDKLALSFYFQSSFPAALGAPIVSDRGKLVTITAFRHPDDANITLTIPTQAIESYLAPEWAKKKREGEDSGDSKPDKDSSK
ncbi:MAG: hypothetical protein ACQEVA_16550 [Myxococcota bacterium]